MPSNRLPTSVAVGTFLKDQRKRLGYTLRDVEELSASSGQLIPFSTLARIEQGKLDPGLPRLQHLLRVYHVPTQAAGDLLDLEEFAGELPKEIDPDRLYELGRSAWQRGDAREALAAFIAVRRREGEDNQARRQKTLLALSSIAGTLGKYHFAKHIIDALLLEPPDPSIVVSVLVQAAKCWQWLGNSDVALSLVERAEKTLTRKSPARQVAFIFHEKASILVGVRQFRTADEALDRALAAYRRAGDESGFCQALGVRVRMHFERKKPKDALTAARTARMYAQRHGNHRLRLLFSLEEARAHLLLRNVKACLTRLGQVVADSAGTDDKVVRFYTHYYYWRAYEELGDDRGGVEFEAAARYLDYLDEMTPEAIEMRTLLSERGRPRRP
ncbi:MAG TPA: helix-turn-helix domain-containing protein [Candidatus Polarisedimenticolaceae bacterium]|nr:helix-turn-helix domain-containing protein [Candidatus Polarisedimenticolaceae bacterium]